MYSLLIEGDKQKNTAKGIQKSFTKKYLKHELYQKCLFEEQCTNASFHCIRSSNHTLATVEIKKAALSCFDDKRYLLQNSFNTLAYGHYQIKEIDRQYS